MNSMICRVASVLLFVVGSMLYVDAVGEIRHTTDMASHEDFKVVSSREKSELQRFAAWFNQDWQLLFSDFRQGAQMYMVGLSADRRAALKNEIDEFLASHAGSNEGELLSAWLRLGAEGWDSKLKVRSTLRDFSAMLGGKGSRT